MLSIRVVDRLDAVRWDWMELEAEGFCLPFQHYEWAEQWCAVLAPVLRARPLIVLVSRSDVPILILPFCILRRGFVKSLEFMDGGLNDYNGPVLSSLAAQLDVLAFRALFTRILRVLPPHDCVQLRNMPAEIGGAPNPLLWLRRGLRQEQVSGHRLPLDAFRELARGAIKDAAKKRRRLARSHRIELGVDGGDLASFDALIGWKQRQHPGGLLCKEPVAEFYRRLMQQSDLVRMFRLCIDDAVVAAQYAVVAGRTCVGLITGYDPDWHDTSPGKLLTTGLLEYLQRENFSVFDHGRGNEAYKAEYGDGWQLLYRYRQAATPLGMAFLVAYYSARRCYYLLQALNVRGRSGRTAPAHPR